MPVQRSSGRFSSFFFPAWWAWVHLTVTANVFGPDNKRTQVALVAAMPGLGLMAAAVPAGLGDRAWAYALGAAWVRLVYLPLWWRQARAADSPCRCGAHSCTACCRPPCGVSRPLSPAPARFLLWGLAIALELGLLAVRAGATRDIFNAPAIEHIAERISLFVVIVLSGGSGDMAPVRDSATGWAARPSGADARGRRTRPRPRSSRPHSAQPRRCHDVGPGRGVRSARARSALMAFIARAVARRLPPATSRSRALGS
ncbi:low temperature requirement protein A [Streptomyces sp. NPDC007883]|uniref:low temperature requirement protein A n=1 Tax=Streptomyces sp. NPDC007883 TaxID=3155116 RepID=UPI0033FD5A69